MILRPEPPNVKPFAFRSRARRSKSFEENRDIGMAVRSVEVSARRPADWLGTSCCAPWELKCPCNWPHGSLSPRQCRRVGVSRAVSGHTVSGQCRGRECRLTLVSACRAVLEHTVSEQCRPRCRGFLTQWAGIHGQRRAVSECRSVGVSECRSVASTVSECQGVGVSECRDGGCQVGDRLVSSSDEMLWIWMSAHNSVEQHQSLSMPGG